MTEQQAMLTVDDLFKFEWLQSGQFSPDGSHIAFSVTHIAGEENEEKEYSTIYLLDVASGNIRKMTGGKQKDGSPAWSPDGKHIAFTSDRDEKPQIFLLPVDGGEAQQLTDLKQGAGAPVWSPDGEMIAFTAGIDYGEDEKPDRSKQPYRVTRNVWRFDAIGDLDLAVNNVYTVDVDSQEVKQLTDHSNSIKMGLEWSPDSQSLLYQDSMLPDRWAGFDGTTVICDRDGTVTQTLDLGYLGTARWLDNDHLLMLGNYDTEVTIGTHGDLYVVTLADESLDNRTENLEMALLGGLEGRAPAHGQWVPKLGISDDKSTVFIQVQVGGEVGIYQIALSGDVHAERVISGERACYLYDMNGDNLLFAVSDINNTPNLYLSKTDGSEERQLTHLNEDFDYPMPAYQKLEFKGTDGTDGADVEGWYVKPSNGAQAPYPTILWIHGGPHGAQGNTYAYDTHVLAAAGYGVLFVNHRASTGYGDAFATAIKGDWGVLDYGDLMAGVDYAIELGLADADNLGCCGISGGGNLSTWIVGNTQRFKAAVPQNPVTNWQSFYGVSDIGVWFATRELGGHPHEMPEVYDRCSPITYAHNCTTPTLMIQCEHDWRCPPEQSEQFYTVLRANGCTVEMLRQPAGSHGGSIRGPLPLRKANLTAKLDWFNQYILGIEPESEDIEQSEAEPVAGD